LSWDLGERNFKPLEHKIEQMRPTGPTPRAWEGEIIKERFAAHYRMLQAAIWGVQEGQLRG